MYESGMGRAAVIAGLVRKPRPPFALLVTDRDLIPPWSGSSVRILGMIRSLRAAGYRVVVVGSQRESLERLGAEVDGTMLVEASQFATGDTIATFDLQPFAQAVARACRRLRPELVLAEYAWLAPTLANVPPGTRRLVDCPDVLHEHTLRYRAAGLERWIECTAEQEASLLSAADVVIAIQESEGRIFRSLLPDKEVRVVLPAISLPPGFRPEHADEKTVLMVGSAHVANETIGTFARDHWPRVLERVPGARLRIVGSIGAKVTPSAGIVVVGSVEDLVPEYSRAGAVVCPVETGTGTKIKLMEALRFGKATVVTPLAVEGVPADGETPWLCRDSLHGCADALADLLEDSAARAELEDRAFAFGERYLSVESAAERLRSALRAPGR
jgi:succinoglycan biosynthesis protein ExoO